MKITLEIPVVQTCAATACAYNAGHRCHAVAITVGDGIHPACDTFFASDRPARDVSHTAGVGACKIAGCRYNSDLECAAGAIRVNVHANHADCATYTPR
ncbi:MAG: DUF1540 domain-containing protein [Vicinamibacterales bacterium]